VRKTPSWPRSWANFSPLYSCIPTGMHGPTCIFWANLTPFSLQGLRSQPAVRALLGLGAAVHQVRPLSDAGYGTEQAGYPLRSPYKIACSSS
jgi:hypothetical protein